MGNRERVIVEIDRLRSMEPGAHRAESLQSLIENVEELSEQQFSKNPWVLLATIVFLGPMMIVVGKNGGHSAVGMPVWVMYLGVVGGLVAVAWIWTRLPKRLGLQVVRIHVGCHKCGYNLDGHASVLGDDVWVGPEVCPECGERYPAIG